MRVAVLGWSSAPPAFTPFRLTLFFLLVFASPPQCMPPSSSRYAVRDLLPDSEPKDAPGSSNRPRSPVQNFFSSVPQLLTCSPRTFFPDCECIVVVIILSVIVICIRRWRRNQAEYQPLIEPTVVVTHSAPAPAPVVYQQEVSYVQPAVPGYMASNPPAYGNVPVAYQAPTGGGYSVIQQTY